MTLRAAACLALCDWQDDGPGVLACTGCGTQWALDAPWTPAQADGTVPAAVSAARAAAAGTSGSSTTSGS